MEQKPTVDPDLLPEAFIILKLVLDAGNKAPYDLVLEYSNAAYAKLVGIPLADLQGKSLFLLFPNAEEKWLFFVHEILENNITKEVARFVPELDKVLTALCFRIQDGYCGCLVHDASPSLAMAKAIRYQEKRYKILADYTNLLPFEYHIPTDFMEYSIRNGQGVIEKRSVPHFGSEIIQRNVLHPQDIAAVLDLTNNYDGQSQSINFKANFNNQDYQNYQAHYAGIHNEDGKVEHIIGRIHELSDLGVVTQVETQDLLHSFVQSSPSGMFRLRWPYGTLLYANDAFYTLRNAINKQSDLSLLLHPDDKERVFRLFQDAIDKKQQYLTYEARIQRQDSSIRWILCGCGLMYQADGLVINGVEQDITPQKELETRLRSNEHLLEIAFEQTSAVLFEFDLYDRTMTMSKAFKKLFGLPEGIRYYPSLLVEYGMIPLEYANVLHSLDEQLLSGAHRCSGVVKVRNSNGTLFWAKVSLNAIFNDQGKPLKAVGVFENINAQKEAEQRFLQEKLYRDAFRSSSLMAIEADLTDNILLDHPNDLYERFQLSEKPTFSQLVKQIAHCRVPMEQRQLFQLQLERESLIEDATRGKLERQFEFMGLPKRHDEEYMWLISLVHLVVVQDTGHVHCRWYVKDNNARKQYELYLKGQAEHDALTETYNRSAFERLIETHLASKQAGTLLMFDLDDFKKINDTFGHLFGDVVLKTFARTLQDLLPQHALIGRLGGDEFVAFIPNIEERNSLGALLDLLPQRLNSMLSATERRTLGCSIGIAYAPEHGNTFKELFSCADAAQYNAKRQGKNSWVLYSPACKPDTSSKPLLERRQCRGLTEHSGQTTDTLFNAALPGLIFTTPLPQALDTLLDTVARHYTIDSIVVLEHYTHTALAQWHAGSNLNLRFSYKELTASALAGVVALLSSGTVHSFNSVDELPEPQQSFFRLKGTFAEVSVPFRYGRDIAGTVLFTQRSAPRTWTDEEKQCFELVARLVSFLLEQLAIHETLPKPIPFYMGVPENLPSMQSSQQPVRFPPLGESQTIAPLPDLSPQQTRPVPSIHVEQLEQALFLQQQELNLYRTTSHGFTFTIRLDEQWSIIYLNETGYTILEHTPESLRSTCHNAGTACIHAEDLAKAKALIRKTLIEKASEIKGEVRIITGAGTIKWLWTRGYFTRENGILHLHGFCMDITSIKEASSSKYMNEELLRLVFGQTNTTILEYDHSKKQIYHTFINQTVFDVPLLVNNVPYSMVESGFIHPDSASTYIAIHEALARGKKKVSCQIQVKDTQGQYRWCRVNYTGIFDRQGKLLKAVGMAEDISAQKDIESRLQHEAELRKGLSQELVSFCRINLTKKRLVFLSMPLQEQGLYVHKNSSYDELFHYRLLQIRDEEEQSKYNALFNADTLLRTAYEGAKQVSLEYRMQTVQGEIWVLHSVNLMLDKGSGQVFGISKITNIDERKKAELQLLSQMSKDNVSGSYNKEAMIPLVNRALHANKHSGTMGGMILLQIDHFDELIETFGHLCGEKTITKVGSLLLRLFSQADMVARMHGEEFAVFVKTVPSYSWMHSKQEELIHLLRFTYVYEHRHVAVSVSCGAVCASSGMENSFDSLYKNAAKALSQAKEQGTSQQVLYETSACSLD